MWCILRREINPRPTYHLRLGEDFTAERFHMIYHISLIEDEFHCGTPCHPYDYNYSQCKIPVTQKEKWQRKISATRCVIKNISPYARYTRDIELHITHACVCNMPYARKIIPR